MLNHLQEFFLSIDISKVRPGFNFKNKEYFKTSISGFITIIYMSFILLIFFNFGRDFIFRENPTLIQQEIFPIKYPNYTNNNNNFTFSIRLEDNDGNAIHKPNLIYMEFIYYNYEIRNGAWKLIEEIPMNYSFCKEFAFRKSIHNLKKNIEYTLNEDIA